MWRWCDSTELGPGLYPDRIVTDDMEVIKFSDYPNLEPEDFIETYYRQLMKKSPSKAKRTHKPKKPNKIYMATTRDKYELPVAVADSAKELADILGIKTARVYEYICKTASGEITNNPKHTTRVPYLFYRIELNEEEIEEIYN